MSYLMGLRSPAAPQRPSLEMEGAPASSSVLGSPLCFPAGGLPQEAKLSPGPNRFLPLRQDLPGCSFSSLFPISFILRMGREEIAPSAIQAVLALEGGAITPLLIGC